jgi:hypothetical protein
MYTLGAAVVKGVVGVVILVVAVHDTSKLPRHRRLESLSPSSCGG